MRRQLKFFCRNDLGFNLEKIRHFAMKFGWEAVGVGSLHQGTAIKNTMSQCLTVMDCLGLRHVYDKMLR